MRTAAAVIGGAGAALGALLCLSMVVVRAAIRTLSGLSHSPSPVDLAFVGPPAAAALRCAAGAWGAWLVFAGGARGGGTQDAAWRGALLMLLAGLGAGACVVAQPFLIDAVAYRRLPERWSDRPEPSLGRSVAYSVPAVALLLGATLTLQATGASTGRGRT